MHGQSILSNMSKPYPLTRLHNLDLPVVFQFSSFWKFHAGPTVYITCLRDHCAWRQTDGPTGLYCRSRRQIMNYDEQRSLDITPSTGRKAEASKKHELAAVKGQALRNMDTPCVSYREELFDEHHAEGLKLNPLQSNYP